MGLGLGAVVALVLVLVAFLLLLGYRRYHRLRQLRQRPFENEEDQADIELNEFAVNLMFFFFVVHNIMLFQPQPQPQPPQPVAHQVLPPINPEHYRMGGDIGEEE